MKIQPLRGEVPSSPLIKRDTPREKTQQFQIPQKIETIKSGSTDRKEAYTPARDLLSEEEKTMLEILFTGRTDTHSVYGQPDLRSIHAGYFIDVTG